MATRKKKTVEEVDEIIEATEEETQNKEETQEELIQSDEVKEEISEPEKIEDISNFDFRYEVKVDAAVKKTTEKVEEVKKATPVKERELYTVKRIEGNKIFAINKKGKYIMLRKQGEYADIKFGDTISR